MTYSKTPTDIEEKIKLLEKILFDNINWRESIRKTLAIPNNHGLPSGLLYSEAVVILMKRVLKNQSVIISI